MRATFFTTLVMGAALVACGSEPAPNSTSTSSSGTGGTGAAGGGGQGGGGQGGTGGQGGAGGQGGTGGQGGGGPFSGVNVVFPPGPSLTDQPSLTVRGSLNGNAGVESLTVAGVPATTDNGFATWKAKVPLSVGSQELSVDLVVEGMPLVGAAKVSVIHTDTLSRNPWAAAFDRTNGRAFLYDLIGKHIAEANLINGKRRMVSGPSLGSGPPLWDLHGAMTYDAAADRVLTTSVNNVIATDVGTGNRTELVAKGSGEWPSYPGGLVFDAAQNRLLTTSMGTSIWSIDLTTGARAIFSDVDHGSGPPLTNARGMELDAQNGRVLVGADRALVSISLTTGDRTVISSETVGSGPATYVSWPSYDAATNRFFTLGFTGELAEVTPAGARTLLSDGKAIGSGPTALAPLGLSFHAGALYALDTWLDAAIRIDTATGARDIVSGYPIGSGPVFASGRGATYDAAGKRVLGYDPGQGQLFAVSLVDGARTILSGATMGNGPAPTGAFDMVLAGGKAFLVNQFDVRAIDLASGDRSIVSSNMVGQGPTFNPFGGVQENIVSDPAGQTLWVLHDKRLLRIDVATGNRTLVADDAGAGTGPAMGNSQDLIYADSRLLLVGYDSVLSLDPLTGNRSYLSGGGVGEGQALSFARYGVLENGRLLVTPELGNTVTSINLATGNRTPFPITSPLLRGIGSYVTDGAGLGFVFEGSNSALLAVDPVTGEAVILSK